MKVEIEATGTVNSEKSSCARLTGKSHAFPSQKNEATKQFLLHNYCDVTHAAQQSHINGIHGY